MSITKHALRYIIMSKQWFELKITLGNILTIISMIGVMIGIWRNLESRMIYLESKFSDHREAMIELKSQVHDISANQTKMIEIQSRLMALSERHPPPSFPKN